MTLELKRIFADVGSSLPISYELDLHELGTAGEYPLKTPVRVSGRVFNEAGVVNLELRMDYTYSAPCDRCGADTVRDYTAVFERMLATSIEGEESDTILTVPGMRLDVDELVMTEVYLSFPRKFLCGDGCRGICPDCGKNLNEGDCGCSHKEIDPRLAKLAELLNQ